MKIFADEFIQAVATIEGIAEKRVATLANELNKDSMIECRNLSIGDSNEFGNEFFVNPKTYKISVADDIHSRKKSVEKIGEAIATRVEKCIVDLIERKIDESETPVTRIRDIRKSIKVVIDQDIVIDFNSLELGFRIGIEEYR